MPNDNSAASGSGSRADNSKGARHTCKKVDESFYFQDAYFEVQNTIFRVHKHKFENSSPVFRELFAVAKSDASRGLVPEKPITLNSVTVESFRQLLNVMFSSESELTSKAKSGKPVSSEFAVEQWVSVLKLSTLWRMNKYRALAIDRLSSTGLAPAERVYLAMTYRVPAWFLPGLSALAKRQEPIGLAEYKLLGAECVLKLCQVRERFKHCASCMCIGNECCQRKRQQDYDFVPDIREVFSKEIAELSK